MRSATNHGGPRGAQAAGKEASWAGIPRCSLHPGSSPAPTTTRSSAGPEPEGHLPGPKCAVGELSSEVATLGMEPGATLGMEPGVRGSEAWVQGAAPQQSPKEEPCRPRGLWGFPDQGGRGRFQTGDRVEGCGQATWRPGGGKGALSSHQRKGDGPSGSAPTAPSLTQGQLAGADGRPHFLWDQNFQEDFCSPPKALGEGDAAGPWLDLPHSPFPQADASRMFLTPAHGESDAAFQTVN